MGTDTKVTAKFDGKSILITEGTVHALDALAQSLGYKDHTVLTCYQGGWRGSSSYSGNTHGREAVDLSASEWRAKVKNGRRLGIWLDHRMTSEGPWEEHVHGARLSPGAAFLDPSMSAQQRQYLEGDNGLVNDRDDDDWRPRYPNVRFVDDGVHERWIANKATQGYNQAGGHSGDKSGSVRPKGAVTGNENIATVKVNGVEWLVFKSMLFLRKSDHSVYRPGFVTRKASFVVQDAPAYGRVAPELGARKVTTGRPKGHVVKSVGYVDVKGVRWERTSAGSYYHGPSLKPLAAAPSGPAAASSINVTLATVNVIARRLSPTKPAGIGDWHKGEAYAKRVGIIAGMLKGCDVVATQEAGTSSQATALDDALDKALGGTWSHYRQGDEFDGGDITQSVVWRGSLKRTAGGEVEFSPAGPGSSHDSAPWVRLEDKVTGIAFGVVSLHLIAGAGATKARSRGDQVRNLVPKVRAIPELAGLPVVYAGDMNQAREDDGDPVGKAFTAFGLTDVEASPCAGVNVDVSSYNGLNPVVRRNGEQLDRVFVDLKRVTPRRRTVVVDLVAGKHRTPFGTDHQPVEVELTIRRA